MSFQPHDPWAPAIAVAALAATAATLLLAVVLPATVSRQPGVNPAALARDPPPAPAAAATHGGGLASAPAPCIEATPAPLAGGDG